MFEILEIPQENFVGSSNPRSHRVQRNFSAKFTAFHLYIFLLYGELSLRKWFVERNKEKKRPDGNRGVKRLILSRSLPAFHDILISAISWSARWDTRSICVACIFHGTTGLRATIADIGRSILQDDREYRGLSALNEEAGGRMETAGGKRNLEVSCECNH